MIKLDYKRILSWQNFVLLFLFAFSLFGFVNFETSVILKILWVLVLVFTAIYSLKINKLEYLILAIFFLLIYDFYNLYFSLGVGLWVEIILLLGTVGVMTYILLDKARASIDSKLRYVYLTFASLVSMEIFLTLVSWPVDPKNKAIILVLVYYLVYNAIFINAEDKLSFKKISPYLAVVLVLATLIMATSEWYK